MSKTLKTQRDRFLAFAFASADMLIEVADDGKIIFATGAIQSLTGEKGETLEGSSWLNLFSTFEQARMLSLMEEAPHGARCGPFLIDMNHLKTKRKGVVTGVKMPYSRNFFVTISLSNELMDDMAQPAHDEFDDSLWNKTQFIDAAEQVFHFARTTDKEADLTMFDFGRSETIPEENWAEAMGEMARYLREQALDGKAVAEIADGRLTFIHDHNVNIEEVKAHIESIFKEKDPDGAGLEVKTRTIATNSGEMEPEEAQKAFYHTINELASGKDISDDIQSLSQSLKALVTDNQSKISQLKSFIDTVNFKFFYQPVTNLKDLELHHYEMLCRFPEGDTQDWVTFAQDVELGVDLDLAVCERAITQLTRKLAGSRTPYAINILPGSIEDPAFVEKLMESLDKEDSIHERLIIEITNAKLIKPNSVSSLFTKTLREKGFKITLDSLAANAKGIEILDAIECDTVKMDGYYSELVIKSEHERSMVSHLAKTCKEKKRTLIGKSIESKEQADMLDSLGVQYGQGQYFGEAESAPAYAPPKD